MGGVALGRRDPPSHETALTDTTSTFKVTDLATGASWQDPTTYTRSIPVVGQDGIWVIPNGNTAVTQADPGFKVFLSASGGRAARAKLAKVDYSTRPMLRRWGVGSASPVTLSPWRRPLTVDTFARAYTFNANPAGNFVRGGKLYRRISLSVFEVELGPSQGIVEKGGSATRGMPTPSTPRRSTASCASRRPTA